MKISYDYEEMILELKEEFENGALPSDRLQILRGKSLSNGYKPVIDWYYDEKFIEEYISQEATKEEIERYIKDRPFLEEISLHELLAELEEMDEVI